VEIADHSFRLRGGEIHQQIAAEDDIHGVGVSQQRGIAVLRQIEPGEGHHPLDLR
jgi:hypothetical protein